MAVIDDLVSSGLSGTQATEVVAVGAGTGSESALVSQGFSGTQAAAIVAGGDVDELVRQGLFGTQATAVNAAVAGGGGGGGATTTYTSGANYGYAGFNGMGTSGYLMTQSMDGTMTAAFAALVPGDTIIADYGTTPFAILTVTGAPYQTGTGGPNDLEVAVSSDTYLIGSSFASLTF